MLASPLRTLHQHAEAALAPYGPPDAGILVVQTYGELELEYAALRKSCVLLDRPERAILEITGPDRLDFLNRMLTQELKTLAPGHLVHSFWLNRKGRIDADITLIHLDGRTCADLDALAAQRTIEGLASFIITEDVAITDATSRLHRFSLHGPTAPALLAAASLPAAGANAPATLADRAATHATIAGNPVTIFRDDAAGEPGFEIILNADHALAIYQHLLEIGHDQHNGDAPELGSPGAGLALHAHRASAQFRLRPAGWHAFNIARIEAGTPLYNIDFGPSSLPHETGEHVLHDRVSFTKGCYLGQEIVARMHSRGHPKQRVVALRCQALHARRAPMDDPLAPPQHMLPVAGAYVFKAGTDPAAPGDPVGAVTSSTLAPMLSQTPIAFASVRYEHTTPGTRLLVAAEDHLLDAEVQPSLRFWSRSPPVPPR